MIMEWIINPLIHLGFFFLGVATTLIILSITVIRHLENELKDIDK